MQKCAFLCTEIKNIFNTLTHSRARLFYQIKSYKEPKMSDQLLLKQKKNNNNLTESEIFTFLQAKIKTPEPETIIRPFG